MKKPGQFFKFFILPIVLLFTIGDLIAADRYSVRNAGTWSNTNMWSATSGGASGASVPTAADNVIIEGSDVITVSANAVCANLSIANGSSLSVRGVTFTVNGITTINGTLNFTNSAAGVKSFNGLVTVNNAWSNTINSAVTFYGGITCSGTFTAGTGNYTFLTNNQAITGILSIPNLIVTGITLTNNGTLTVSASLTGTGELLQAINSTLNIGGTSTITTLSCSNSGNTVSYTGAAQTIPGVSYNNLTFSGSGNKTMSGNVSEFRQLPHHLK